MTQLEDCTADGNCLGAYGVVSHEDTKHTK